MNYPGPQQPEHESLEEVDVFYLTKGVFGNLQELYRLTRKDGVDPESCLEFLAQTQAMQYLEQCLRDLPKTLVKRMKALIPPELWRVLPEFSAAEEEALFRMDQLNDLLSVCRERLSTLVEEHGEADEDESICLAALSDVMEIESYFIRVNALAYGMTLLAQNLYSEAHDWIKDCEASLDEKDPLRFLMWCYLHDICIQFDPKPYPLVHQRYRFHKSREGFLIRLSEVSQAIGMFFDLFDDLDEHMLLRVELFFAGEDEGNLGVDRLKRFLTLNPLPPLVEMFDAFMDAFVKEHQGRLVFDSQLIERLEQQNMGWPEVSGPNDFEPPGD